MQLVSVCHDCGRTIEKQFVYCPWCGLHQKAEESMSEILDPMFDRLEIIQNKNRLLRINKIGNSLDELEKDLSMMVLQAELSK